MNNSTLGRLRLTLIPVAALVVAACASTPANNPALDEARALYNQAAGNVAVARSAPVELRRAQDALQKAEAALKAGDDASAVEHYAYLARQRSSVALQAGQVAESEATMTAAQQQRDRILMDARSREASVSMAEAQRQRDQAQKARAEAERMRQDAEKAGAEALAAQKLAEERLAAAEAAKAKNAKLQAQLAELEAKQTDRGMVLTLGDVLFDTGRAELKAGAMSTVDRLAAFLRDNPERTVTVEGYTDSVGGDAYNLTLSDRRAGAVKAALLERGIAASRVMATGFGEAKPVASNDTAEGRQRNRRIEVVISGT